MPELRKPMIKGRAWEELRKGGARKLPKRKRKKAKAGQWIWVRLPNRVIKMVNRWTSKWR